MKKHSLKTHLAQVKTPVNRFCLFYISLTGGCIHSPVYERSSENCDSSKASST